MRWLEPEETYVKVSKAAEITGLDQSYIRTAIYRLELPAHRVGRYFMIPRSELHAWMTKNPVT